MYIFSYVIELNGPGDYIRESELLKRKIIFTNTVPHSSIEGKPLVSYKDMFAYKPNHWNLLKSCFKETNH